MSSVNRFTIVGRIGNSVETRFTPGGTALAELRVSPNRGHKTSDDKQVEETAWHRVEVGGKQAETCAKYVATGGGVLVEGRLKTDSWEDKESGQKGYSTKIVGQSVQFLGSAPKKQETEKPTDTPDEPQQEIPF